MQSGIVTTLSVFKANAILQGSMTGCSYLVRCDPPAEDLKQTSEVTSENSCELETFKEPWSECRFQALVSEQKERFLTEPVVIYIMLLVEHKNHPTKCEYWDHTQCGGIAAPCYYSVGMKISAAKKGLYHRDVAQSLCEKGQQFKQEIRHHNPIKSEDYRRAPTFFTWSLTNIFDQDVCSCTTDTLFNIILTIYIQIWIIKLLSSTKVILSRTTIKSIPAVWVLFFCRFLMSETNWTT